MQQIPGSTIVVGGLPPRQIWRAKCETCGVTRDVVSTIIGRGAKLREQGWDSLKDKHGAQRWFCNLHNGEK